MYGKLVDGVLQNPPAYIRAMYEIVEINGNWGKLKSGIGWINLNYTEKVK